MKVLKLLLILIFIVQSHVSLSQQPSHFILGQEELSGIDIYHILQDSDQIYWLATSQGIIKFDGYTFKKIECEIMLSSSVFDLQMDYNNVVHCKNLSGQIFQIKNDSCVLRVQIPDSLMSREIFYMFDKKNDLIVITNSTFRVNANNEMEYYDPDQQTKYSCTQPILLKDSSVLIHNYSENKFYLIRNNHIETIPFQNKDHKFVIKFFYLDDKLYYFNKSSGKLLNNDDSFISANNSFNPIENNEEYVRYFSDNENLWLARQGGGTMVFKKDLSPLFNGNTFFKNSIISAYCKDKEGNVLLGTFGEGIIVVTNLNLTEINLPDANAKITRITSGSNNAVFLGTQNGRIYKIDSTNRISLFRNRQFKNIEVLEYFEETNELLVNDRDPAFINLSTKKIRNKQYGAIKDVVRIDNGKYIISSNMGVSFYSPYDEHSFVGPKLINNFSERTNCVNYNPTTKIIYAGTSLGLKIGDSKEATYFKLNDTPIICRDILYLDEKIYITTKNNGILIFKNKALIDNWNFNNSGYSNSIYQIKEHKGSLFVSTNAGIFILNKKGEVLNTLSKSDGLYANHIIDFEIKNDILWLVHQKGVQPINIKKIKPHNFKPSIWLSKLLVNNTKISIKENSVFNYDQNKFEFNVSAKNIRFSNEIKYRYRLEGIDKTWQVNNYYNNKIEYKSLPPGKYTFNIKSVFRNNESEMFSYSFSINPPFWETWWFYGLMALSFITLTFVVFKVQIKKHRKKNRLKNELNASKLIAIQSQMNPHFIFNAINSIQDLILKGDIDNSYNYIIKFSKLVRQTLNFSDKEFIDIEDEIELLEIYLELEKLRFKDDFEYSINCDFDDTQVPPMLVQPFVENAIKHGLLHKDGLKKLEITFVKNEILYCTITDNGIGRKKAQEIKERQQKNHQSFSVNATKGRFEIMKSHYQQDLGVVYEDLMEDNVPAGTKVIINMPFKQNY